MQTVQLNIAGMTCGGCAKSVERALLAVAGVSEVSVSHPDKLASIRFDENQVSLNALIEAVEEAGFDVVQG